MKDIVAEGDKVVVRGMIHGVHAGQLMNIAPTGSEVSIQSFSTYRLKTARLLSTGCWWIC
ncbi:MAG: ester cyclase [Chloroflexi bacterium]|nr:ester cyclase [Chloroflexota bacterium]